MKKIFLLTAVFLLLFGACQNEPDNPQEIQNQIMEYKKQIADINSKIAELEKKLNNDSLSATKNLLVDTLIIKKDYFEHFITVTGNVDAEKNANISPEMNGQVVKIYVEEGQKVYKGQLLIKLNDEVLQKNLAQLQTSLYLADTMFQKQSKLFDQNVVSEVQYLKSKNQKESIEKNIDVIQSQISLTRIKAPFSGIVDKINIKEGELAAPGRGILQVVNLNTMIVEADVSEKYIPFINVGDSVSITFPTYPDIKIKSTIFQKGNVIDRVNRTFWIKIKFSNIDKKIKPNMLSTIKMKDFEAEDVIIVPTNILNKDINGWFLFTVEQKNDKTTARKKYIEIGRSDSKFTIVKKGLKQGASIITKGYSQVSDGMNIQISNQEKH